jgi:hypothetical protein
VSVELEANRAAHVDWLAREHVVAEVSRQEATTEILSQPQIHQVLRHEPRLQPGELLGVRVARRREAVVEEQVCAAAEIGVDVDVESLRRLLADLANGAPAELRTTVAPGMTPALSRTVPDRDSCCAALADAKRDDEEEPYDSDESDTKRSRHPRTSITRTKDRTVSEGGGRRT